MTYDLLPLAQVIDRALATYFDLDIKVPGTGWPRTEVSRQALASDIARNVLASFGGFDTSAEVTNVYNGEFDMPLFDLDEQRRHFALDFALRSPGPDIPSNIVGAARQFETFLRGEETTQP